MKPFPLTRVGTRHTHLAEADKPPLRPPPGRSREGPLLCWSVEGTQHWRRYSDVGPHGWQLVNEGEEGELHRTEEEEGRKKGEKAAKGS